MSNNAELVATKFINRDKNRSESYGFRIYYNYGKEYDNLLTEEQFEHLTDRELFIYAVKMCSNPDDAGLHIINEIALEKGMYINDDFYSADVLNMWLS